MVGAAGAVRPIGRTQVAVARALTWLAVAEAAGPEPAAAVIAEAGRGSGRPSAGAVKAACRAASREEAAVVGAGAKVAAPAPLPVTVDPELDGLATPCEGAAGPLAEGQDRHVGRWSVSRETAIVAEVGAVMAPATLSSRPKTAAAVPREAKGAAAARTAGVAGQAKVARREAG